MNKLGVLTIIMILIAGCAATSRVIVGPDGSSQQLVSCSYVEACYEKAREVCGGNYKIVNTSTETGGMDGDVSTTTKLLVKCEAQAQI